MSNIVIEFQTVINKHIEEQTPMSASDFMDYINKINKHQKNQYMKDYIIDKPSLDCDCGGRFKRHQLHIHRKSKRHLKYISENSIITVNH